MGKGVGRIPGPLGKNFHLGRPKLKKPAVLRNPKLVPLEKKASNAWNQLVQFVNPAKLRRMLGEIYSSERWADANTEDKEGNVFDPMHARLPNTRRERDARRPTKKPTLRLKDPKVDFQNGLLNGTASFVLELPTPYGDFDSPTPINVKISSHKDGLTQAKVKGSASVFWKLARANFTVRLHYDPLDVVKAAFAIAAKKGIDKEMLEKLLSEIRMDISALAWVVILPTWVRISTSSLLPMDRPLFGTKDRLLPI
jgi:hypothetical protein